MALGIILGIVILGLIIGAGIWAGVEFDSGNDSKGGLAVLLVIALVLTFAIVPFSMHTVDTGKVAVVKNLGKIKTVREDAVAVCGRSGDSKRTANEIGIHAIRMGNIVGEHTVQFFGENETFEIKHTSYSRSVFADGALKAANYIITKENGLYNMDDLIAKY